jgi:predicted N-acyltransferase
MIKVRITESIADLGKDRWQALFPGELEGYDYLLAIEEAGLEGFAWRYVFAEEDGRLLAVAPGFVTRYSLDTTLAGVGKQIAREVRRIVPAALSLQLSCLGSPCTESALLGFAEGLDADVRASLVRMLVGEFERDALSRRSSLIAVKDVPEGSDSSWRSALAPGAYVGIPGLPIAHIEIDFATVDDYLMTLSAETRKDMRRKLRSRERVRVEWRSDLQGVLDRVQELYRDTLERAEMKLEELTPGFFQSVLRRMGKGAVCALYFSGDELLAFNLLLRDETTLLDKFFCMEAARGREHNLYFLSWFANIGYCLEHGLKRYQSGQAAYENKLRLGSSLTRTTMYVRHRNPVLNRALRVAAPLFSAGPTAQQLTRRSAPRRVSERECERA